MTIIQIAFSFYSCSSNDNLTSNEVTIGNQVWMAQNLSTDTFQNGDKIIQVKSMEDWAKAIKNKQATWCYYEFNDTNEKYGKIYNYFAVIDSRKLAPGEWRIPKEKDWKLLTINLDPNVDTAKLVLNENFVLKITKAASKLKSAEWNGTNESNFNALPGGCIFWEHGDGGSGGDFFGINSRTKWWGVDSKSKDYGGFCGYNLEKENCYFDYDNFEQGYYVRCIK